MRERIESASLVVLVLLVLAFAASAVLGFAGRGRLPAPAAGDARRGSLLLDEVAPRVRVEVLNGSGRTGLARHAMGRLREKGFDVVYIGNAAAPADGRTAVIDRVGKTENARAVARALGVGAVSSAPDPTLYLEVTVVLGGDWPPEPQKDAAQAGRDE